MSRLDRFIARVAAQKFHLEHACAEVKARWRPTDGIIVELGLGNGRTYHHLCEHLPGYRIVVFDRGGDTHPENVPPAADLVIGEIQQTAARFARDFGAQALMLHTDILTPDTAFNRTIEAWLPDAVVPLMRPGAIVVTSLRLAHAGLVPEHPPGTPPKYEYFLYRRRGIPS